PGLLARVPGGLPADPLGVLRLAVEGRLGDAAPERALLVCAERLRADGAAEAAAEQVFLGADRGLKAPALPKGVEPEGPIRDVLTAALRLSAIRTRLEGAGAEAAPPDPSGEEASAVPADLAEADRVLRLLVAEGGRPEVPLLRRSAQLRAVVESGGSADSDAPVATWKDVVGPGGEKVLEICSAPEPSRACAAFTRRLLAAELRAAAERCAQQALAPLPDRAAVRNAGASVGIGAQGADQASLAEGERRAAEMHGHSGGSRTLPVTIAAGGAICAVGALLSGEGALWVFAVGALVVAGVLSLTENRKNEEARVAAEHTAARFRTRINEAVSHWQAYLAQAEESRSRAAGDIDAIRRLLAAD